MWMNLEFSLFTDLVLASLHDNLWLTNPTLHIAQKTLIQKHRVISHFTLDIDVKLASMIIIYKLTMIAGLGNWTHRVRAPCRA